MTTFLFTYLTKIDQLMMRLHKNDMDGFRSSTVRSRVHVPTYHVINHRKSPKGYQLVKVSTENLLPYGATLPPGVFENDIFDDIAAIMPKGRHTRCGIVFRKHKDQNFQLFNSVFRALKLRGLIPYMITQVGLTSGVRNFFEYRKIREIEYYPFTYRSAFAIAHKYTRGATFEQCNAERTSSAVGHFSVTFSHTKTDDPTIVTVERLPL